MPISSPRPRVVIPEGTLYEQIFGDLSPEDAQKTAIIDSATGRKASYGELKSMVDAFAGALAARGVRPGDVVAVHCPNSLDFVVVLHGIMRAGAIATPLGSLSTVEDARRQLEDSSACMFFGTSLLGQAGFEAAREAGIAQERIFDLADAENGLEALLAEEHPAPDVQLSGDDIAALPFSSGTTGLPKGVVLSHRNLVANVVQAMPALESAGMRRDSMVMGVLPFFHIYGLNVLLNSSLALRSTIVTMPRMDLARFLQLHEKYRVDFSFITPTIALALAKHPIVEKYDLSSLKYLQSGATVMRKDLALAVQKRLGVTLLQGFGMTEASPVTHNSIAGVTPPDSIGVLVANTECKVVDLSVPEHPEILPPSSAGQRSAAGELWVRGPQVMLGYLNNEEATRQTITADGWLRTGDVVEYDHEGNVYVVDRVKELIKYKGYQVAPAELESLILTRDDIADCAVVGFNRPEDHEEVPRAFVVPQPGAKVLADELMEWISAKVAPYKKVRMVEFIEEIPKSAAGKILRKDLKLLPHHA